MLSIVLVTLPFFALVLCGYIAVQRRLLPLEAIPGLNSFVLFFALPCMLFRFGSGTPLAQLLDASVFFTYLLCALLMVGFTVMFSLNQRIGWNDAAFGALVAAFPNTGFMGVPLLVALLGPAASGPAIVTIMADLLITNSLCIALSRLDGAQQQGARTAAIQALKGVVSNPMPWAILLGTLFSALDLRLPTALAQTVSLLADAASPVALFTIGAVLARSRLLSASGAPRALRYGDFLPIVAFKLLLHPLLVFLVGALAIRLGVPLTYSALTVIVLVAALPSASNVTMLSERFGANTARVGNIVLISTALAFLSFSLVVKLLR
ncbi:MAG: AEC family transporter [Burkholderiales bacterium]|nr:AEC family transporter [Burkholderiales bacterium]